MSTPAVSQEAPKKGFSWKRLFIKAAGFGAGFALIFAILIGVGIWYWNRPKPPKQWDKQAIKAEYYNIRSADNDRLAFIYVLENTTDSDYSLDVDTPVKVTGLLEDTGSLVVGTDIKVEYPIFVPGKHKSRIVITTPSYGFNERLMDNATDEQRRAFYLSVAKYVSSKMSNLNGFTLFDELNKYEIILPSSWKQDVEEAAKKTKK